MTKSDEEIISGPKSNFEVTKCSEKLILKRSLHTIRTKNAGNLAKIDRSLQLFGVCKLPASPFLLLPLSTSIKNSDDCSSISSLNHRVVGSVGELQRTTQSISGKELQCNAYVGIALSLLNAIELLHESHIVHGAISADSLFFRNSKDMDCATEPDGDFCSISLGNYCRAKYLGTKPFVSISEPEPSYIPTELRYSWAPPEEINSKRLSKKSDIWGFGVTMLDIALRGNLREKLTALDCSRTKPDIRELIDKEIQLPRDFPSILTNMICDCLVLTEHGRVSIQSMKKGLFAYILQHSPDPQEEKRRKARERRASFRKTAIFRFFDLIFMYLLGYLYVIKRWILDKLDFVVNKDIFFVSWLFRWIYWILAFIPDSIASHLRLEAMKGRGKGDLKDDIVTVVHKQKEEVKKQLEKRDQLARSQMQRERMVSKELEGEEGSVRVPKRRRSPAIKAELSFIGGVSGILHREGCFEFGQKVVLYDEHIRPVDYFAFCYVNAGSMYLMCSRGKLTVIRFGPHRGEIPKEILFEQSFVKYYPVAYEEDETVFFIPDNSVKIPFCSIEVSSLERDSLNRPRNLRSVKPKRILFADSTCVYKHNVFIGSINGYLARFDMKSRKLYYHRLFDDCVTVLPVEGIHDGNRFFVKVRTPGKHKIATYVFNADKMEVISCKFDIPKAFSAFADSDGLVFGFANDDGSFVDFDGYVAPITCGVGRSLCCVRDRDDKAFFVYLHKDRTVGGKVKYVVELRRISMIPFGEYKRIMKEKLAKVSKKVFCLQRPFCRSTIKTKATFEFSRLSSSPTVRVSYGVHASRLIYVKEIIIGPEQASSDLLEIPRQCANGYIFSYITSTGNNIHVYTVDKTIFKLMTVTISRICEFDETNIDGLGEIGEARYI
ncbi:hypothetical protein ADUPG1_013313 [Aduncisulcus paluster]|uniref:Protein kinase domain-containing protein n=1 Tax=Aduncisulcus paluster TaxID=2918883 RepID=A0ABQ5K636_9EUKA|nr:hypothetical protein ADUPG1_013313 [Aduncisulcus paluster]|eukprot:gnl/Carplike_NY0171/2565_a3446_426.p1 GENE.gnl/Carplike_NY0171/2565_a3446_426~~gnl/Carplike_NY0171/2565_a3446_426.p1  ORF type:complete len:889 (+),score=162.38 gnl/Carplike_NY0171/2565_a3446_426:2-2668(+)